MKNTQNLKPGIKHLAAMSMAAAMVMTSMAAPVFADSANPATTNATIDTSLSGSITLYKVKENNGNTIDNHGVETAIRSTNTPMKDIEFTAMKIADLEDLTRNQGVGVYFDNLDPDFKSLILNSAAGDKLVAASNEGGESLAVRVRSSMRRPEESDGKEAYTSETMQDVMETINAAQGGEKSLNDFVRNNRGNASKTVYTGKTDANGKMIFSDLPLGLYLICETDFSTYDPQTGSDTSTAGTSAIDEVVANQSSPLLVSVPMTNQTELNGNAAGTVWQYDVTVYPKNQTISNPKRIINEDDKETLIDHGDYEIGETVHQVLLPEAPMLQKGNFYTKFIETDTMDNGLTFDKINGVYIVPRIANPEKITEYGTFDSDWKLKSEHAVELAKDTDYTLTQGSKDPETGTSSFTVALTDNGLVKLNAITGDSQVMILFDSVLNKETSHVGDQVEEKNQLTLTWNTADNDADHSIKGNKVGVYTYQLNITKNGVKDPTKISFTFTREGTGANQNENHQPNSSVQFVREGDGIYHLYDRSAGTGDKAEDIVTTVHPGADGKLYIKGLDEEHYIMTETATEDRNDETGSRRHELLKSPVTIALTAIPTDDNNSSHGVTGALDPVETTITADGNTAAITVDKGTASFHVENYESLNLRTGGEGRAMVYGATLLLVVTAGSILVIATRKKQENA